MRVLLLTHRSHRSHGSHRSHESRGYVESVIGLAAPEWDPRRDALVIYP